MADLVMGAMPSLIPKLYQLLEEEYKLQAGVKERISSLTQELELAQAALRKVAQVPWDQLDEQVQIWARHVREGSYDMEDILDTFLVRVQGPESAEEEESLRKHLKKMTNFLKKSKARRKISGDVKDIMTHLQEVTERCRRYKVDDIVARPATASNMDPRLAAMYTQVKNLVGMDKSSSDLICMLHNPKHGDTSSMKMKIVSIVGVGGLGKTTLAKAVYEKIKGDFNCSAFVPVGRNPDLKKIFKDILIDFDKERYLKYSTAALDERQLIDELRSFFHETKKRYLIVIDDIWEVESWERIKLATDDDNNTGGRIIITTRKFEVATKADKVYKQQPLPFDISRELFIRRISGHEGKYVHNQPNKIMDKLIRKCSGIPLAIITMASLLAGKPRDKWSELYNTIDFVSKDNKEAENTMRILSFSYYDLPSHLRTCLLYLSIFPEDSVVLKDSLVWMWVAEGFVHQKNGIRSFDIGEGYFNDLINRSMIQAVQSDIDDSIICGCRVHDVVLDFIRSMSREENFFTILDSNQGTVVQGNVRRLANHKRTMGQSHFEPILLNILEKVKSISAHHNRTKGHIHQGNHIEMPKLRSFISLGPTIETWVQLSSLTLLRVLALENCRATGDSCIRVENLGRLLHLRFLSLRGTEIARIPEGIGALRFLQTLDLLGCYILGTPSSSSGSLPKRLACLRISLVDRGGNVFSVEGMTLLEELTIQVYCTSSSTRGLGWPVDGLGSLRELRVLEITHISLADEGRLMWSLGHHHVLHPPKWQANHLRYLAVHDIWFSELPSCIDPSCVPNLSHLDLKLQHLDDEDLKNLGGLPELRYLSLDLMFFSGQATIHNIDDSGAGYFPKLRCFELKGRLLSFVTNKDDNTVSFHIWDGYHNTFMPSVPDDVLERGRPSASDDESMPSVADDELERGRTSASDDDESMPTVSGDELERARPSVSDNKSMPSISDDELERAGAYVSDDELKSDNEMQSPMPSISHDDELHRPLKSSKLQQGLAAVACYLLAFFQHVLAFVKRWPLKLMGQHPLAAPAPRFMPSLQVLHLDIRNILHDVPNCNLGWKHLSSLREIKVVLDRVQYHCNETLQTELRRAAQDHPNNPTLHVDRR